MTRHNACTNPACGSNVTGWGGGSTPTRVTGLSGFPVTTGAQYTSGTFQQTQSGVAVPGTTYTGSIYIRSNGLDQNSKTFYLGFTRSSGGDDFSNNTSISISNGVVTRLSLTAVAPALATGVYVLVDGINAGVVPIDITAVLLEAASGVDTYFDGNSSGGSWDGTANNSASTLADAAAFPDGIAIPVALGAPSVSQTFTVVPDGLAIPVTLGLPTAAPAVIPPVVTGGSGGWWTLRSVSDENREWAEQDRQERDRPLSCPNDGEPLTEDVDGRLHCHFDGWTSR